MQVACLAKWGPVADQLREAGIEATVLGAKGASDVRVLHRFVKLVREHQQIAFRAAYLVTGSAADAEDAAQDGFVKAWRSLDRFRLVELWDAETRVSVPQTEVDLRLLQSARAAASAPPPEVLQRGLPSEV